MPTNESPIHTRIAILTKEIDIRSNIINVIAREGSYPEFLNHTLVLRGRLAGLKESIGLITTDDLVPLPPAEDSAKPNDPSSTDV